MSVGSAEEFLVTSVQPFRVVFEDKTPSSNSVGRRKEHHIAVCMNGLRYSYCVASMIG